MRIRRIARGFAWLGVFALTMAGCGKTSEEQPVNTATGTAAGPVAWTRVFGGTGEQVGWQVATTDAGQIIVAGTLQGQVDFGAGGQITSVSDNDIFLAWIGRDGKIARVKRFGESGGHIPLGIAVDASGGVIISGLMIGSIDFGGGLIDSAGGSDAFLASFDADGNYRFAVHVGNPSEQGGGQVALAQDGSILWSGTFEGDIDIGGTPLMSKGDSDLFVASISADGKTNWAQNIGGMGYDGDMSLALLPSGQILLSGYYEGTPNLGDGALPDTGMLDGQFLLALDGNGKFAWSRGFANTAGYFPFTVHVDETGSPWLVGAYAGDIDLFGTKLSTPNQGIAIAQLDADGKPLSTQIFVADQPGDVQATPARGGGFVLAGDFGKNIDLPGQTMTSAGESDLFLVWIDATGRITRQTSAGGAGREHFGALSMLPSGQVVLTGGFDGAMSIGDSAYSSVDGSDGYVLLLN